MDESCYINYPTFPFSIHIKRASLANGCYGITTSANLKKVCLNFGCKYLFERYLILVQFVTVIL